MGENSPRLQIFGVAHSDESLTDRIVGGSPDQVSKVYHESPDIEGMFRDTYLYRPLNFLAPTIRGDTLGRSPLSECEKAANRLADDQNAELHHIGMSRKKRAHRFYLASTLSEWTLICGIGYTIYLALSIGDLSSAVVFLLAGTVLATVFGDIWNRLEYPYREEYMAGQIRQKPPKGEEWGVVVVGNSHREPIAERLADMDITSEDLTQ